MTERDPSSAADLSARARRGLLSQLEEAALEAELGRDPTLRIAHRVGLDMDRSTTVRVGDEALIARAVDGALRRVSVSGLSTDPHQQKTGGTLSLSPARRRRVSVLVAAALVCATGLAAGMWAAVVPGRWFTPKVTASESAPLGAVTHHENAPSKGPGSPTLESKIEEPEPTPIETGASAAGREHHAMHAVPEATAQALFKSANLARRDGNFSLAERLYSELIGRFSTSDEAGLARVSLGKLLLANGDPSDAEREFGQYLKGGKGQLAEEALVSRAESFENMGRTKAERATWQRLLAEYPTSVYAAEAKGRLDALKSETVTPAP